VLNKVDLLTPAQLQQATDWLQANTGAAAILPTAALDNSGVEGVRQWAVKQLPLGPTLYPKACGALHVQHMAHYCTDMPRSPQQWTGRSIVCVHAKKTFGPSKQQAIVMHPSVQMQDSISEQSERFFVAEIIREKIFLQYRQEIPYSTAVGFLSLTASNLCKLAAGVRAQLDTC
jgi:GTPase Era involved in 16S rRNA processing